MQATARHATLASVADALARAEATGTPIAPITATHPELGVDEAYAIQTLNVQARGTTVVGHKIGLTSQAMQDMLGVDEPDFGVLYADRVHRSGVVLPTAGLISPRIEPEFAFVLRSDLHGPGVTAADVWAATGQVLPAVEVIDSRIADWKIGLVDTIADNASCHCAVLAEAGVSPGDVDLGAAAVRLLVDGEVVQAGTGAAVLGDPAEAVAWLANAIARYGQGLQAGHVVLSGSMTAAVPLRAPGTVVADFGPLGTVEVIAR